MGTPVFVVTCPAGIIVAVSIAAAAVAGSVAFPPAFAVVQASGLL